VPKVILKYFGADILILFYLSEHNVEITMEKNYFFQVYCFSNKMLRFLALIFKCSLSLGMSKN
jgi:hypothetical protein